MARLTPAGRGAVAVVGLRGSTAVVALASCFERAAGSAVAAIPVGRIVFGKWQGHAATAGEDVVVARLADDRWEIHCHGGEAAVAAVMEALAERGAVRQEAAAWCLGESLDPLAAAAFEAWPHCLTERTSACMAVQAGGALRRACLEIAAAIAAAETSRALALLDALIARAPCGLHLTRPWRVALVGRPNAGKSSLINRLVGYERAIVSPIPGTTRDVVAATTAWQGWPVRFADTAGLRTTADAIEAAGIERSLASHATADLTVQVADLSQPWTDEDRHLVLALGKRPTLLAHNKADLLGPDAAHPLPDRPPGIAVSARTGIGLERLLDAVIERLVPVPPAVDDALPFTPAIVAALEETRRQLSAGQLAAGQLSAGQLAAGQGNMASSRLAEFL